MVQGVPKTLLTSKMLGDMRIMDAGLGDRDKESLSTLSSDATHLKGSTVMEREFIHGALRAGERSRLPRMLDYTEPFGILFKSGREG